MTQQKALALLRIALGSIFLWAFLDKVFGLGYATSPERSWLAGASPTAGFLAHGTSGPLASVFAGMAGCPAVDWLFMMGLLGVGLALILGIGMKVAKYSGIAMMALIYLAAFPPENNPVVDEHLIYIASLIVLYLHNAGDIWGLGKWWKKQKIVKKYPVLI